MTEPQRAGARLNQLLTAAGQPELTAHQTAGMEAHLALLLRWNQRTNLTAIRHQDTILARHFVESILCARSLPHGIATLLDFGSGAGFPGIPIALCCPHIAVTLAESQGKKAAFLNEAVRTLGLTARVHATRADALAERFDCVTLRAVDRMERAVASAATLVRPGGWLVLITTAHDLPRLQSAAGPACSWTQTLPLPSPAIAAAPPSALAGSLIAIAQANPPA